MYIRITTRRCGYVLKFFTTKTRFFHVWQRHGQSHRVRRQPRIFHPWLTRRNPERILYNTGYRKMWKKCRWDHKAIRSQVILAKNRKGNSCEIDIVGTYIVGVATVTNRVLEYWEIWREICASSVVCISNSGLCRPCTGLLLSLALTICDPFPTISGFISRFFDLNSIMIAAALFCSSLLVGRMH